MRPMCTACKTGHHDPATHGPLGCLAVPSRRHLGYVCGCVHGARPGINERLDKLEAQYEREMQTGNPSQWHTRERRPKNGNEDAHAPSQTAA